MQRSVEGAVSQGDGIMLTKTCDSDDEDEDDCWATNLIHHEGELFFCRVFKKNGYFTVDVAMKGSLEECKEFRIEAAILDANTDDDEVEPAVKASFRPRPLKEDNKPGFCLTVPFNLMSEVGKAKAEDDAFDINVKIKVVKAGVKGEGRGGGSLK